ncbi:MAG: GyrI-like domain-containing protein [Candidatus Chromulinivorax sp.]
MNNELEYEVVLKPKQFLVGLAIKTDNDKASTDIAKIWGDFYEGAQEKIKNAINDEVVCAYLDYQGDETQPYTYVIGCVTNSCDVIPAGMVCKELAEGWYAKIEVFGEFPESLMAAWEDIWDSDIDRAYTTDFEVYDQYFTEENDYYFNIYLALPDHFVQQGEDQDDMLEDIDEQDIE